MTPQQFQVIYPQIINWIHGTLATYATQAQPVASRRFSRLPLYFSQELLTSMKFVVVDRIPVPPLSAIGLNEFVEFERGNYGGITYLDTFFVREDFATDEGLYFHELIHTIQWRLLSPERFLAIYADGLEKFGYKNSPLEVMAYEAEADFRASIPPFDAEALVTDRMQRMLAV